MVNLLKSKLQYVITTTKLQTEPKRWKQQNLFFKKKSFTFFDFCCQ